MQFNNLSLVKGESHEQLDLHRGSRRRGYRHPVIFGIALIALIVQTRRRHSDKPYRCLANISF